jgi:Tfp pilus assembly protein PilO
MDARRGPLIAGIVGGVLALLLIVLLVLPKMNQVNETQEQVQVAQDQEVALQAELRSLQDAQAQAEETEQEILALDEQVPPTVDLPELFRLLQAAADRSAVDFFQFSPGTPVADASGAFSTVASQIVVTGGYFNLQEFLYSLETLPRAAKVMNVTIAPSGGTEGETAVITTSSDRLQMQLAVEFYTTDSSAGPGSSPGPTQGVPTAPQAAVSPTPTAAEGA